MSGAVRKAAPGSLLGRLGPVRTALRPPTTGAQVLSVLEVLDELAIPHWVAGGWGVDALAGRQSRDHDDVDVVLADFEQTIGRAVAALVGRGFRVLEHDRHPAWMPDRWHLEDGANCHVELVSLDRDRVQRSAVLAAADPAGAALFATGVIEGRVVPCLSAATQRIVHGGYAPRPADRHDLVVLQDLPSAKV